MAAGQDAQAAGERVETLLTELRSHAGPQVAATAEELVSCLVELYGAGLAQIVAIVGTDEGDGSGSRLMDKLVADPLVESLLLVHDLHPLDTSTRIRRAVEQVLPQLGATAGEIEYQGLDDQGIVHLRLERTAGGCQSTAGQIQTVIEQAVAGAAPEAAAVAIEVIEAPPELPLLQISRRPARMQGAR
jgi:Fe-S cluster biogenesis protein NfuA